MIIPVVAVVVGVVAVLTVLTVDVGLVAVVDDSMLKVVLVFVFSVKHTG